jgi:hypothetical protein
MQTSFVLKIQAAEYISARPSNVFSPDELTLFNMNVTTYIHGQLSVKQFGTELLRIIAKDAKESKRGAEEGTPLWHLQSSSPQWPPPELA